MVPLWRTAGSPIMPASSASAGMASPTIGELATEACLAVAAMTSERPFISSPRGPRDGGSRSRWGGAREPLLHARHQRVPAGDPLGVLVLGKQIGGLPHR